MTNTYITQSKVQKIRTASKDFNDLYGIKYIPFTRKLYFYFFVYDNKKYVHKESLRFVYTNADTYTNEKDPLFCIINNRINAIDPVRFLESYTGDLLPKLIENNDKFLVYEYVFGEPVAAINRKEFYKLKEFHYNTELTPFYNSMTFNLVRSNDEIKLVDLKHFEPKDTKPFFVYMYNEEMGINTLYIEHGTKLDLIKKHLEIDYPVSKAIIEEM